MEITTRRAAGEADVKILAALADEIWRQHFTPIIGEGQVAYMLDKFQDAEAMAAQMADGYIYIILYVDGVASGYCACRREEERLFLSKLYVRQSCRGKGLGRRLFDEACACGGGLRAVYLTVNKHNDHTIAAYKKMGFVVVDSVVNDIGNGYVMDDYIMEMPL